MWTWCYSHLRFDVAGLRYTNPSWDMQHRKLEMKGSLEQRGATDVERASRSKRRAKVASRARFAMLPGLTEPDGFVEAFGDRYLNFHGDKWLARKLAMQDRLSSQNALYHWHRAG